MRPHRWFHTLALVILLLVTGNQAWSRSNVYPKDSQFQAFDDTFDIPANGAEPKSFARIKQKFSGFSQPSQYQSLKNEIIHALLAKYQLSRNGRPVSRRSDSAAIREYGRVIRDPKGLRKIAKYAEVKMPGDFRIM